MPEQVGELKITHAFEGSESSAVGGAGLDTEKSKAAAQKGQPEDKKKTNVFKKIGGILTGVLGIQVSFAAMLRQSQIATGFLGAVFQVLGAILDSFLLAFAPMLFRMVQDLARLIPIARAFGETIAAEIVGVVDVVKIMTERIMPALATIGQWLMSAYKFISELNPLIKRLLFYAVVLPRILNFFGGGIFYKILYGAISKGMMWALMKSKAKEAGLGMAKGAGQLLMAIPHAKIIMIALAVVAVVGTAIWAIFKPKQDKNEAGAVDISGQLGKRYLPSQASQLGGTLNEAYSSVVEPFTDAVKPQLDELAVELAASQEAIRFHQEDVRAAGAEWETGAIQGLNEWVDTYGNTLTGAEAMQYRHDQTVKAIQENTAAAGAEWRTNANQGMNQWVDTFNNTLTGTEATAAASAKASAETNEAIKKANNNWVTDIAEATGLRVDKETLLTQGTDAMANNLKIAREAYKTATDAAGATLTKGANQSKNQLVDTTGTMMGSAGEMKEYYDQIISKGEMDKAMGSLSGTMFGLSDYIATIYEQDAQSAKALAEAAIEQKTAAVAFQVMSESVMTGHEADRARREQERSAEAMNFAGAGDFGKFFDYLSNY
jgi:hypothetical protein